MHDRSSQKWCIPAFESHNLFKFGQISNNIGRPYCRSEMYAGHVACCPLLSHVEYMRRALCYC